MRLQEERGYQQLGGNIQPLLPLETHKPLLKNNSPALPQRRRCFPRTARPGSTSAPWFSGRYLRTPKAVRGRLRAGRPLPGLPLTSSGSAGRAARSRDPRGTQTPAGSPDPWRSTEPGEALPREEHRTRRGARTGGSTDSGEPRPEGSKASWIAPAPHGKPGPRGSPGPGGSPDLHCVCTVLSITGLCPACLMGMLCFGAAPALSPQIHQFPCPSHPPSRCIGGKIYL